MLESNILVPSNMLDFQCAQCGECCKGWTVYVDKTSLTRLQKAFSQEKLDKGILRRNFKRTSGKTEDYNYASVRMLQNQCGFLGEGNCCALHHDFGADHLPVVCRLFPRKIIVTPRGLEFSFSLSCREAVEHLVQTEPINVLTNPQGFSFVDSHQYHGELTDRMFSQSPVRKDYFALERQFLQLIQNRRFTIQERLIFFGLLVSAIQNLCQNQTAVAEESREILESMVNGNSFYQQIQEITPDLPYQLKALKKFLDCRLEEKDDPELGRIIEDSYKTFYLEEEEVSAKSIQHYQEAYQTYFRPQEQEIEHILENYLVNYILGKNFFLYRLPEAYYLMIFFYKIIRFLALDLCKQQECLINTEILLTAIHLMEKGIGHNRGYYNNILKKLARNGYTSVPHAIYLLKI